MSETMSVDKALSTLYVARRYGHLTRGQDVEAAIVLADELARLAKVEATARRVVDDWVFTGVTDGLAQLRTLVHPQERV